MQDIDHSDPIGLIQEGFLIPYPESTRIGYGYDLAKWRKYCADNEVGVLDAKRIHVEMFGRKLEADGYAKSTVGHAVSTVSGFYRYCEEEGLIAQSPARYARRPKVPTESTTQGMDRMELGSFIATASVMGIHHHALSCLLGLNGLRVGEACGSNIQDLASDRGHKVLKIIGKGGLPATIPLSPRSHRAIELVSRDRFSGAILLGTDGERLTRWAALRMVKAIAKKAGIKKKITPHSLRHSFITAALDAGVALRDVQIAARHSDPRMTIRYDRNRQDLDRHAAYIVSAYIAGAA